MTSPQERADSLLDALVHSRHERDEARRQYAEANDRAKRWFAAAGDLSSELAEARQELTASREAWDAHECDEDATLRRALDEAQARCESIQATVLKLSVDKADLLEQIESHVKAYGLVKAERDEVRGGRADRDSYHSALLTIERDLADARTERDGAREALAAWKEQANADASKYIEVSELSGRLTVERDSWRQANKQARDSIRAVLRVVAHPCTTNCNTQDNERPVHASGEVARLVQRAIAQAREKAVAERNEAIQQRTAGWRASESAAVREVKRQLDSAHEMNAKMAADVRELSAERDQARADLRRALGGWQDESVKQVLAERDEEYISRDAYAVACAQRDEANARATSNKEWAERAEAWAERAVEAGDEARAFAQALLHAAETCARSLITVVEAGQRQINDKEG